MARFPSTMARRDLQVTRAETPTTRILLLLAVGVGLYQARDGLTSITLAPLLSFVLAPLADLLRCAHVDRSLSALLTEAVGRSLLLSNLVTDRSYQTAGGSKGVGKSRARRPR